MPLVSRIRVFIDNVEMTSFVNYKPGQLEYGKTIDLMNSKDYVDVAPLKTFTLDYAQEKGKKEMDFSKIDGTSTVSVRMLGGGSHVWTQVKCLSEGESTFDGQNAAVRTISFQAKGFTRS